jgi:hypothetical protein
MKYIRAIFAGIAGALAMSLAMFVMRSSGINISLEALLGSLFEPRFIVSAWFTGFLVHLLIGAIAGLVYAFIFEVAVQRSGILMGAGVGLAHGMLAGLLMSGIPAMNPLDPTITSAPGPFFSHLSYGPLAFLFLHCLFGTVTGVAYGAPLQKPQMYTDHMPHHP